MQGARPTTQPTAGNGGKSPAVPHPVESNKPVEAGRPVGNAPGNSTANKGGPNAGAPNKGGEALKPKPTFGHTIGDPKPSGVHDVALKNGGAVRMRPNGRPSDFHDPKRGVDIHNNLRGGRRIDVERADHSHMVIEHGRPSFIAHGYGFHGHDFERRTYAYHGRVYDRFYGSYGFHGVHLAVYAPGHFYAPGFYGYAYAPWAHPVVYGWGFGAAPWYAPYSGYFVPLPVYPTPSAFLADYMISQSLQADYAAQQDNGGTPSPVDGGPMDAAVQQQVAAEVQGDISLENYEATQNAQGVDADPGSSSIARLLSDGRSHVFVAGDEVDVVDANGQECAVTEGDVLQISAAPPADATDASMVVLASKGGNDCRKTAVVTVPLDAVQEMQNHMRTLIDQGLAELQANQAKGTLPAAPAAAHADSTPVVAQFAALAPPPDPSVAKDIDQETKEADKSQKDLLKEEQKSSAE
jgi:hypothetical protein